MGCASSKQAICEHCHTPYSSVPRSYSGPLDHPRLRKVGTRHAASFSSSTLESLLKEVSGDGVCVDGQINVATRDHVHRANHTRFITTDSKIKEFVAAADVLEAKNWSSMIEGKFPRVVPKTPTRTPPGEPETINTWELMEGLDDFSPLPNFNNADRSFSFHSESTGIDQPKLAEDDVCTPVIAHSKPNPLENATGSPKPQWLQMMEDDSVSDTNQFMSDFDPEIVSQFRKALEEISPVAALNLKSPEFEKAPVLTETDYLSKDLITSKERSGIIESDFLVNDPLDTISVNNCEPEVASMESNDIRESNFIANDPSDTIRVNDCLPEDIVDIKEVSDFLLNDCIDIKEVTEIREKDCVPNDVVHTKVVIDTRENDFLSKDFVGSKEDKDISMHTKCPPYGEDRVVIYFTSLRVVRKTYEDCCLIRTIFKGFGVRVDERDVSMHNGFLQELKELSGDGTCGGLPRVFVKGKCIGGAEEIKQLNEDEKLEKLVQDCAVVEEGKGYEPCELCGDVRFVPCERCSGSCKVYCEDGEQLEGNYVTGEFKKCPDCNENGIVRCPVCCY